MRERIASLNGALDIESEPGAGTRLSIEIPLA
jgi:signal transduction histidine kinase